MSSFRRLCEQARDDRLGLGRRYLAVRHAAERYAELSHVRFESIFVELAEGCGFRVGAPNDAQTLCQAANQLEAARGQFLEELEAFSRQRQAEKQAGQRCPLRRDLADLYARVQLGTPAYQPSGLPIQQAWKAEL